MRVPLAQAAVQETRLGLMEDKVVKNGVACELPLSAYANLKTCGIISRDASTGITELATPVGPVAAVLPTTNPTSTTIMKSLFALKTRNAMIFLPHPRAAQCSNFAMEVCRDAAERAGAPKGILQCVTNPSRSASALVMEHPDVKFILATGGPGMVKASYSCGKPAVGVGAGNAPVLVDELANLEMAVSSIVMGKTFDNGTICASEQSTVIVDAVYDRTKALFEQRGVHFLYGEDRQKLANYLIVDGHINPDIVGQSAQVIAERIGVSVPPTAIVLGAEASEVGEHEPLSYEKLSPVLTLYRTPDFEAGVQLAKAITMFGGQGHTAALYTDASRRDRIERFAEEIPAYHQLVNAPTSLGAIGSSFNFALDPSLTLGVGTDAGSSASTNVTPMHLLNIKKVAERQEHLEWLKASSGGWMDGWMDG
jgi:acetaldehyde dehydrogenase/alcohol dehydrogenase